MSIDRKKRLARATFSRISAISLSVCLTAVPLLAGAHVPKEAAASAMQIDAAAQPAVTVVDQFSAALKAGDLVRAKDLLANDVLILESGGAEHSREEYLGGHAVQDAAFLKDARITLKQRTARSDGNLAWVGTESDLHATNKGKSLTLLSTETMVLRRDAGVWRIVHIHWSSRPVKSDSNPQP
ncbi:MAG: nuclear transport factor 2 family protein [Casimicrobiaceae bacterium]